MSYWRAFLCKTMSLLVHQRSLLPNILLFSCTTPMSLIKTKSKKPSVDFQTVKWALSVDFCGLLNINHPLKAGRNFGHPLPHTLPLITQRKQLWTVSLCWVYEACIPRETKGPSVAASAPVQRRHSPELQAGWVPTHSCSTHAAAVAATVAKRANARWEPGQCGGGAGAGLSH